MAKPRTNHAACAYWADGILTREPQSSVEVNSIIVRGDTVYSFGSHFPMGIIVRDSKGRCVRVLLNSDHWPGGGWANTGGDQSSCRMEANDRAAQARWHIDVLSVPLTAHGRGKDIRCKPRAGDPEPPFPYLEVPTYFYRTDPGPEPVKDPHGCIAGRVEHYEYQTDSYISSNLDLYADDQIYAGRVDDPLLGSARSLVAGTWLYRTYGSDGTGGSIYSRRTHTGVIEWGEEQWAFQHYHGREPAGVTYTQCPHCEAFDRVHRDWSQKFHGHYPLRGRGYKLYAEMMATYGSEAEWREARLRDWRRVREGRKAHAEWRDRNYIPFVAVSWTRHYGVMTPNLDAEGYPTRKDQEAYYRAQREEVRKAKRRQRDHEKYEREQRQLERFKAGVRRRRGMSFEQRAAEVAAELAALNAGLRVSISTNESQEITA